MTEKLLWKKILISVPIMLLSISIIYAESYRAANSASSRSDDQTLQILGYNFNRQLVQISVTLWNKGDKPVTIMDVFYDEEKLVKGLIGPAVDDTASKDSGPIAGNSIPTNILIFAAVDHWNMDTVGPSTPTIQPNGVVTLFLGVTSNTWDSKHLLRVVSEDGSYTFNLEFRGD